MGKWAETQEAYFGRSDSQEERETMKGRVLPILFNTEMVQAILDGRKTVTRRCVKPKSKNACGFYVTHRKSDHAFMGVYDFDEDGRMFDNPQIPPCQIGDTMYVRETWAFIPCIGCNGDYARGAQPCYDFQAVEYDDGNSISDGCFVYRADCRTPERITWRPSIHMPKEAARIWLRVTDVRVEWLQEINGAGIIAEGIDNGISNLAQGKRWENMQRMAFEKLWDSAIKKSDRADYGWSANPWVWVIEFERCEKPETEGGL